VDRQAPLPNTTKELPHLVRTSKAYQQGTLKAYIASFDDTDHDFIQSDNDKLFIHLLPAYRPLSDDYLTLRHALPMLYRGEMPLDVHYVFALHPPGVRSHRRLPVSPYAPRIFPLLPYTLTSVSIVPYARRFVESDRHHLTNIVFDFLTTIGHAADPRWNNHVGQFQTEANMMDPDRSGCYLEFTWQYSSESAILCAESVSHLPFNVQTIAQGTLL
jgi:hypothetical protein